MILMHKNTPVAEIKIENNIPVEYKKIYNKAELPIGTIGNTKEQERILLNHWYKSRSIPQVRPNLSKWESSLGISSKEAFIKSAGVSITDTYWLKENENIKWEDINYHQNGFDSVLANLFLKGNSIFAPSPDFTTDGIMEKFWFPITGRPYLFKIDSKYGNILSANEVVFYKIASDLGIQTTPYFAGRYNKTNFCFCPCFVKDEKCDFINAMQIKHSDFSKTGEALIRYFIKDLGFEKQMKEMITLDCLFHNTDRHEKNFGFLIWEDGSKKFVPLYDNGFCLGINRDTGHPITDNDMKLLQGKRQKIVEQYGLTLDVDISYFLNVLEEVYQEFNISEFRYLVAKEELLYGISLLEKIPSCQHIVKLPDKEEQEYE